MIIYRIEHNDGIGPYFKQAGQWCEQNHCNDFHPSPEMEGLPLDYDYYCGFKNKKSLTKWFNSKELKNLKELGFKLVKYKVHPKYVHVGKYQVIFNKKKAKLFIKKEIGG